MEGDNDNFSIPQAKQHHDPQARQQHQLHFYLHVGPTKTGSTTIQENIGTHNKEILRSDNWVMYKFRPHTVELTNCLHEYHRPCQEGYLNDFRTFLRHNSKDGNNVIVSWESMWDRLEEAIPKFRHEVEQYQFQLTIVVVYRRLYEWLASRFYQDHRFSCPNITHGRWSDELIRERTSPIPLLSEYMTNETENVATGITDHPTAVAVRDGKIFANNVIVFNLHGKGDMMGRFYCSVLKAERTCAAFRNNGTSEGELSMATSITTRVANEGHSLFYERMAQQAIARDLAVAGCQNCTEITKAIVLEQEKRNSTMLDLPHVCPKPIMVEMLLNDTIESEELLLPKEERIDLESLRNEIDNNRLAYWCDADVDKIFQDVKWRDFFVSLEMEEVTGISNDDEDSM